MLVCSFRWYVVVCRCCGPVVGHVFFLLRLCHRSFFVTTVGGLIDTMCLPLLSSRWLPSTGRLFFLTVAFLPITWLPSTG